MSILHDEGQLAIAEETRRVLAARKNLARQLDLTDRIGEWDEDFWRTAVEQGWTALAVPEECGGLGLGLIELGLVAQEAGRVLSGAPFLTGGYGAVQVLLHAPDEVRDHWLPRLAAGGVTAAFATMEGNAILQGVPAVQYAAGRLNGLKSGVAGGAGADVAVVSASAADGPVLVLVDLSKAIRKPIAGFDNARLHADLVFDNTPGIILCEGDGAVEAAIDALIHMAVLTAHEQVGGAEAMMLAARDYALERKAFGQPIGAFQSVKHRLAELYGLVEIARASCYHAASRAGQADFVEAGACARLSATEAYDTAARDGTQIHGGLGVAWDTGLHLHMRRARSLAIELGNSLFWEDLLAVELIGEWL